MCHFWKVWLEVHWSQKNWLNQNLEKSKIKINDDFQEWFLKSNQRFESWFRELLYLGFPIVQGCVIYVGMFRSKKVFSSFMAQLSHNWSGAPTIKVTALKFFCKIVNQKWGQSILPPPPWNELCIKVVEIAWIFK
jgi:hypothetical protein